MKDYKRSALSLIAALAIVTTSLTGCSQQPETISTKSASVATTDAVVATQSATISPTQAGATVEPTTAPASKLDGLTSEQQNSISMLNYLTVLTLRINSSRNSRLFLQNAYSELLNNTYPNAVDGDTLFQLNDILDALEEYRMTDVKRERLDYVYEQNQAQAIRSAIPNPLGLIGAVQSFSVGKLLTSIVYMAVDSTSSYLTASSQADIQYLQDGWALDDEESAILHKMRTNAFSYMITMVNAYNLPGDLALTEQSASDFVDWSNETNIVRRIQLLEANGEIYSGFGPYWLVLAESYYYNSDYAKCLEAIESYQAIPTRIFRRDCESARILPMAIVAAGEVLSGDAYISTVDGYLNLMLSNTGYDNWALRYFAAQTYISLYNQTGSLPYLQKAYDLALNNVTNLVQEQTDLNAAYLADVKDVPTPKGSTKKQEEEIKAYNKQLHEERTVALAPISESLLINCDLLFALAETLDVSDAERSKIDSILHENGEPLFLVKAVDSKYWPITQESQLGESEINMTYDKSTVVIPVVCVSGDTSISVTVSNSTGTTTFDDWVLKKVERKDKADQNTFMATYESTTAQKYSYAVGDTIQIDVCPYCGFETTYSFEYVVDETKTLGIFFGTAFRRTK